MDFYNNPEIIDVIFGTVVMLLLIAFFYLYNRNNQAKKADYQFRDASKKLDMYVNHWLSTNDNLYYQVPTTMEEIDIVHITEDVVYQTLLKAQYISYITFMETSPKNLEAEKPKIIEFLGELKEHDDLYERVIKLLG